MLRLCSKEQQRNCSAGGDPVKYIAVQGCELELTPASSPPATVQITTPPSQKVKAGGKPCYKGTLQISITGYTGGTITVPGSGAGSGSLSPGARKCKIEGMAAVLEGDSASVTVNGQQTVGSSTAPATQPVTVKIKSAGQTKNETE